MTNDTINDMRRYLGQALEDLGCIADLAKLNQKEHSRAHSAVRLLQGAVSMLAEEKPDSIPENVVRSLRNTRHTLDYEASNVREKTKDIVSAIRRLAEDIEREAERAEGDDSRFRELPSHIFHTLVWGVANINNSIESAQRSARELSAAKAYVKMCESLYGTLPATE